MKQSEKSTTGARRKLLKSLSVGGIAANTLPSQWVKPVVDLALLPAHAQMSEGQTQQSALPACDVMCSAGISVGINWTGQDSEFDPDLEMETPGGTRIAPKALNGVIAGRCGLMHAGDARGSNDFENISGGGPFAAGRYQIFVRNDSTSSGNFLIFASACGDGISGVTNGIDPNAIATLGSINLSSGGTATVRLGIST